MFVADLTNIIILLSASLQDSSKYFDDIDSAVVLFISILSLILNLFPGPLETLQRAPATTAITDTFTFHGIFRYSSIFSFSLFFTIKEENLERQHLLDDIFFLSC